MIKLKRLIPEGMIDIRDTDVQLLDRDIDNNYMRGYGHKIVRDIIGNGKCWFDMEKQVAHIWKVIEFETQYWEALNVIGNLIYVSHNGVPKTKEEVDNMNVQSMKFVKKKSIIKIPEFTKKVWKTLGKI